MLLKLGKVISRLILACAMALLGWAIISFLKSGEWKPFTLAEILAFYRISVPDFGLRGLSTFYAFAGSIWVFVWLLAIGLMIALASAKIAPESTINYFKAIVLLPVTIITLTLDGFFYVVRGIIKYTLFGITTLVALVMIWWGANYLIFSHQYSEGPNCSYRDKIFGNVEFNFLFDCIDVRASKADDNHVYFAFFMASNIRPNQADTGHAWLATLALRKSAEGPVLVTDYDVTGYGPPGGAASTECMPILTWAYLAIRPAIPFASPVEQYWCLKGAVAPEGPAPLHDLVGKPIPVPTSPSQVDAMLGANPAVVLAVSISRNQYDIVNRLISEQVKAPRNYQLGLNDCTTFVRDIAEAIGLYVPPRIVAPFPSQSIYAIRKFNLR